MGCFPCTGGGNSSSKRPEKKRKDLCDMNGDHHYRRHDDRREPIKAISNKSGNNEDASYINRSAAAEEDNANSEDSGNEGSNYSRCRRFRFAELESATENFKLKNFLGEGGFGEVYKGCLVDTGEVVAIKKLNRDGCQGSREFQVEVQLLSYADHPNLVKLIGCCDEGIQRVLVYEYMPLGSLEDHLHGPPSKRKQLDWNNRMKIAAGAARGLEYLHDRMDPPIVYRDLKCANILLGEGYHPKLSDFGLARTGPAAPETHVSTRVMGTYGYCAPEYAQTGQLTVKSDIYSFGVVLLEIITGRKAIDNTASPSEQTLVNWAKPLFKDRKKFCVMADPSLEGQYPVRGLYQALAISAMCVNEKPLMRPIITEVVAALDYLASQTYDPNACPSRISRRTSSSHRH